MPDRWRAWRTESQVWERGMGHRMHSATTGAIAGAAKGTSCAAHRAARVAIRATGTVNRPEIPTASVAAASAALHDPPAAAWRRCPADVLSIAVIATIRRLNA